mgnify:CR=1 FL=1
MMPFHGPASIAVFPKKKILGISKYSDLVGHFSNDLTLQEKLTEKIAMTIPLDKTTSLISIVPPLLQHQK